LEVKVVSETPLLDENEKGPWPSTVTEIKKTGYEGLLKIYELAFKDRVTHWAHGGMVGYPGYDAGVIGRMSDRHDIVRDCHTLRLIETAGWFYSTDALRKMCDIWDKYGSGLMNFHGATGDIQLIGVPTENIVPCFNELAKEHWDLGGSGGDFRTASCCVGPARCENAMIDTLDIYHTIMTDVNNLDAMHRPRWPYKFKLKISGCPTDCNAGVARADFVLIGTWRDDMKIDQDEVKKYAEGDEVDVGYIASRCPANAMNWDGETLTVDNDSCMRCMYCINKMPKALSPGDDRGATVLLGGRARGRYGAFLGWPLIPFLKVEPPYTEVQDLIDTLTEWWDENGRTKERMGETIYRIGAGKMLVETGLKANPTMVRAPRNNPFWFYLPGEIEE
jgi:sulfite reductase alpha subunit